MLTNFLSAAASTISTCATTACWFQSGSGTGIFKSDLMSDKRSWLNLVSWENIKDYKKSRIQKSTEKANSSTFRQLYRIMAIAHNLLISTEKCHYVIYVRQTNDKDMPKGQYADKDMRLAAQNVLRTSLIVQFPVSLHSIMPAVFNALHIFEVSHKLMSKSDVNIV